MCTELNCAACWKRALCLFVSEQAVGRGHCDLVPSQIIGLNM